jgi:hypothetical protein
MIVDMHFGIKFHSGRNIVYCLCALETHFYAIPISFTFIFVDFYILIMMQKIHNISNNLFDNLVGCLFT